jgi:hypothetical protein
MCWGEDAGEAWERVIRNTRHALLIDEAHFVVSILTCPTCSQAFLKVMTERVDWYGGMDPSHRIVIPIESSEKDRLIAADPLTNDVIENIGRGRRSLHQVSPAPAERSIGWGTGIFVGFHD